MMTVRTDEPLAVTVVEAIQAGDVSFVKRLLSESPGLASARIGGGDAGMSRTLLHVATDWPGHFPNGAAIVAALIEAGAEVNARFNGPHSETPLHWAASSEVLPMPWRHVISSQTVVGCCETFSALLVAAEDRGSQILHQEVEVVGVLC